MDYKRQKPKAQHKQRDTGNLFVSFQPKQPSAWDIWESLSPNQKMQLDELGAKIDAAMAYSSGRSKWAILDLMAHGPTD
jgi:hypothetical protein